MTAPQNPTFEAEVPSEAQIRTEINKLLLETFALAEEQARLRARQAELHTKFPMLARHDWLVPMLSMVLAASVGAFLTLAWIKLLGG